jgi:hypothetical protein
MKLKFLDSLVANQINKDQTKKGDGKEQHIGHRRRTAQFNGPPINESL